MPKRYKSNKNLGISRRDAINKLAKLVGGFSLTGGIMGPLKPYKKETPNIILNRKPDDLLRLGIIGFGIRGEQLVRATGFATPQWLDKNKETKNEAYQSFRNQKDLNVIFTGVCDLFDSRAENALRAVGKTAKRYHHYQDMLASDEIDAVLIATPDHLHARMIIDAVQADKHVYVEKCMTHTVEEAFKVYDTVSQSDIVFQLGHQLRQKDTYLQAKDILHLDILGKTTLIQTTTNRNSPNGAWVYEIPEEASSNNIDWQQFDPDQSFDLDRFFRWRKYWDYGTGLSGDLLTHEFDSLNFMMDVGIPRSAIASGGISFYQDGREVPDVFQVVFEYPKKNLTLLYSATLANDNQRPMLLMGHDATMHVSDKIEVWPNVNSTKYEKKIATGIMESDQPFYVYPSDTTGQDSVDAVSTPTQKYFAQKGMMGTYQNGRIINPTHLHIKEWLYCIRNNLVPSCNIDAGFDEAITAHMATLSYKIGEKIIWDKTEKKIKNDIKK